ncbi:MAG: hypothetical protein D8M58_11960 [Calditrichaeota bacterium]|nr:MAG: hypothetical protein DWQ03_12745 [Calditrichota bacterium]MBL1206111.1 hypothetical protein [Calditrichota bacterium]NOG45936.1 hypothetical protein [Calditrichota bacterium]
MGNDNRKKLSDDQKDLIKRLREEAREVKDCFTKFSFQALVFTSITFGLIVRFQGDHPIISLASLALIFLLQAVARIGTYKYATANRNFSYELHLHRSMLSPESPPLGWKDDMRELSWEEAIRAWRVVQATIFHHLYYTDIFFIRNILPNFLKHEHRPNKKKKINKYLWFEPSRLVTKGTKYHAGSYLSTMFLVLNFFTFLAFIPIYLSISQIYYDPNLKEYSTLLPYLISVTILLTVYILWRVIKTRKRRQVLESGLLSIHSSSIIWQAVTVAHYRAIKNADRENNPEGIFYKNYTQLLSEEAEKLKHNIFDIHLWIHDKCCFQITQQTIEKLSLEKVPQHLIKEIKKVKGNTYKGEFALFEKLNNIIEGGINDYRLMILKHSKL